MTMSFWVFLNSAFRTRHSRNIMAEGVNWFRKWGLLKKATFFIVIPGVVYVVLRQLQDRRRRLFTQAQEERLLFEYDQLLAIDQNMPGPRKNRSMMERVRQLCTEQADLVQDKTLKQVYNVIRRLTAKK